MKALLLLLLLPIETSALKRIVHRIVDKKTWHEARDYCRQHHKDLLTLRNQEENDEIFEAGWIGLYREPLSFMCKWSNGHVNDNFCIWAAGEPDPLQYCGYKKSSETRWHSKLCTNTFPFYCFDDPLVLSEEKKPWEGALQHCRHLTQYPPTVYKHHSYELASPLSPDSLDTQHVFQGGFNKVWIGLRYLGDRWWWLTGQQHQDNWDCLLRHQCGTLERNATTQIKRRNCEVSMFFLCSRK